MTAADVQAIAESVTAVTAVGAVTTWLWRANGKVRGWRKRRRLDEIRAEVDAKVAPLSSQLTQLASALSTGTTTTNQILGALVDLVEKKRDP